MTDRQDKSAKKNKKGAWLSDTRSLVFLSLLTSLALAISLLEQAIPLPFIAPGAKPGFSNIVILLSLTVYGFRAGLTVALLKSFLLLLVTGSVTSFWYSSAGALLSSLVMGLALKFLYPHLTLIGISELGAFSHNTAQIFVASLVLGNFSVFVYLPILSLLSLVTGYFVGLAVKLTSPYLFRASRVNNKYRGGFNGKNIQEYKDKGDGRA